MTSLRLASKEKRDYIRMSIEADVLCKMPSTSDTFRGQCKNLSHTGMQFVTAKHLKTGDMIDITVNGAGGTGQAPLKAVLNVIRVDKNSESEFLVSGELKNVR